MASDFGIRGAEDIDRLVKAIRTHADSKTLRRELYSGLNRASKPIRAELEEAIPLALPKRGGLAALYQRETKFTATAKSGRLAGVSIRGRARGRDARLLTRGRLRHPVWGNRENWVEQTVGLDADALPKVFDNQKPEVQRAILRVMNDVARKLTEGI